MNVKIIRNEQDYEAAMARLSALVSLDPEAGSSEEDELELLTLVIQDFERQTVPPISVDPVEAILFRMDQMGLIGKDDPGGGDEWDEEILKRLKQIDDGSAQFVDRAELKRRMRQHQNPG